MRIFDITRELLSAPVYEGDPFPIVNRLLKIEDGDVCNLTAINMCLHTGTHVDAPSHYVEEGRTIEDIPLEKFIGDCKVISVFEKELTGQDIDECGISGVKRLLIKGYGKANLTRSAAFVLVAEGVELIGIDAPSISTMEDQFEVHRILQLAGVIILEGLDLSVVQSGDYTLFAPPLKISGVEGAPCRAILMKE